MLGSLPCQLGAVGCSWDSPWRVEMVCDHGCCGWCGLSALCPGRLCLGLELWETCSLACWMAKWFTAISASSTEGVLNGLAISFPRSFPLWQHAWTIWQRSSCSRCSSLIISQWSIRVLMCVMRSWGSSPGLAWPQSLPILQGAHGYWHCVSFPVGYGWGRQKLWPWSPSVPLCCQLASIVHASLGIWCLGLQKHTWGGPHCLAVCGWGGASSPGYGKIWRRSGMHLGSSSHRQAGLWRLS